MALVSRVFIPFSKSESFIKLLVNQNSFIVFYVRQLKISNVLQDIAWPLANKYTCIFNAHHVQLMRGTGDTDKS